MKRRLTRGKIKKYERYLQQEEKSRATVEKYIRDLNKLYEFLPRQKQVGREQLLAFKHDLMNHYQETSVNSILAGVNGYLNYSGLSSWRLKTVRIQKALYRSDKKELTGPEYRRMLETAERKKKQRLYWALQTICGTGIRVSELRYITVEALQLGSVQVRCKNKSRLIWIPGKLQQHLLKFAAKENISAGPVFVTRSGKPVDRSNLWSEMKKIAEAAGVAKDKVYPHNLRHLFARSYYSREKDIVKLADILGHSSMETTRIYTISTGTEHARQIESLGLVI